MGRLAGFSYKDVTKKLRKLGFEFYREAKGDLPRAALREHEIWFNLKTNVKVVIPHHKTLKEGTLRGILSDGKVSVERFLDA